jgi:hypothetical protein
MGNLLMNLTAYLTLPVTFSVELSDENVTEQQVEQEFHEIHSVKGTLEVQLTNGQVHILTAEEVERVVKCLGILDEE